MNRRKLFSFLPLAPVLAAAAVVTESQAEEKPADNNANTLRLMGMKKKSKEPYYNDKAIMYLGNNYIPDDTTHVTMAVGRDGNLWLKSADGDWKRVVTE
jgi:hypothetical protein